MESYHILSRHILLKTGNKFNRKTPELNCLLYIKGSAQHIFFSLMNAYFLLMNSKRCITLTEAERATRHEEVGEGFSVIYSFIFRGSLAYLIII